MNIVAELYAIAKALLDAGKSKTEVWAFLDQTAIERPDLAPAIKAVKELLEPFLDQATIDFALMKAVGEVLALLRTKYGLVSDAPELGLA